MDYTLEEIYALVGKDDKTALVTFKVDSEAYYNYGSYTVVVFVYTQYQREEMDKKLQNKPYSSHGRVKAKYINIELSQEKIELLLTDGINSFDIARIEYFNWPEKNTFHSKEIRTIQKTIIPMQMLQKGGDAGSNMPEVSLFQNTIGLLIRTSDVFMNRIKNFQMSYHLYDDSNSKRKEMAYQSLGWDHDNCIKGCVDGIINGHLVQSTIDSHGIAKEELQASNRFLIEERLKRNLQYESLIEHFPTEAETKLARSVSTNLTSLSEKEVLALSKHAEVLTEIQVKLYCPSLLKQG